MLLAYFSRAGENYFYGGRTNLEVGNTEVLAGMIGGETACDVHRIEGGQIHATTSYFDAAAMMAQLGLMPELPPATHA